MKQALVALVALALVGVSGCERSLRNMYDQPRYRPLAPSPLWPDGRSARMAVEGTVAHSEGRAAGATSGRLGALAFSATAAPVTPALIARGRDRFDIFCSPCHGLAGEGDGMVARRGFPHPPSFHTDRLRAADDAHLLTVIAEGYGAMHSYATRVAPADRPAIVAYIRALQLSQHAPVAKLEDADRARLAALATGVAPAGGARR